MKTAAQFISRQCTVIIMLCSGFALLQGFRVGEGLWQGSGLHGYVIELGKAHNGQVVSVWSSFIYMLIALGLAAFFGLIARLSRRPLYGKEIL
jgi:hypothetical protein